MGNNNELLDDPGTKSKVDEMESLRDNGRYFVSKIRGETYMIAGKSRIRGYLNG